MTVFENEEDARLLTALYERYRSQMLRVAVYVLHSPALAEEAVHEAILRISRDLTPYRERTDQACRARVLAITKNTAVDILRREARYTGMEGNTESAAADNMWDQIRYKDLVEALRAMPEIYRDVMVKKCLLGWTNRQIAEKLNLPEGTVASRIKRARLMIARQIEEEEKPHD